MRKIPLCKQLQQNDNEFFIEYENAMFSVKEQTFLPTDWTLLIAVIAHQEARNTDALWKNDCVHWKKKKKSAATCLTF